MNGSRRVNSQSLLCKLGQQSAQGATQSLVNTGTAASNLNATAKLGHVDIPLVPRTAEAHPGLTRIPVVLCGCSLGFNSDKTKTDDG